MIPQSLLAPLCSGVNGRIRRIYSNRAAIDVVYTSRHRTPQTLYVLDGFFGIESRRRRKQVSMTKIDRFGPEFPRLELAVRLMIVPLMIHE